MRRTLWDVVRDVLRRRKVQELNDTPRTRISTPHWARATEVVHPERDMSEWVWKTMERDWDGVVEGRRPRDS